MRACILITAATRQNIPDMLWSFKSAQALRRPDASIVYLDRSTRTLPAKKVCPEYTKSNPRKKQLHGFRTSDWNQLCISNTHML